LSDPFLECPARRVGPFGLRRGSARARRRIFDAPACSQLGYQHHPDRAYVALIGRAVLIEDRYEIRRRWLEKWRLFFPGGPDDPDTIFVRMNVDRIELCVRGVTPEPFGSRPSVLERGDDRSWKVASD